MNDPLSKKRGWEKCKYKIKTYRLFRNRQKTVVDKEDYSVVIDPMATMNVKDTLINLLAELKKIYEYKNNLYQKTDMIYKYPDKILISHFYAPKKKFFDGEYYPTYWINLFVIWLFSILLYFSLYFGLIKKMFKLFENFKYKLTDDCKEKNK